MSGVDLGDDLANAISELEKFSNLQVETGCEEAVDITISDKEHAHHPQGHFYATLGLLVQFIAHTSYVVDASLTTTSSGSPPPPNEPPPASDDDDDGKRCVL